MTDSRKLYKQPITNSPFDFSGFDVDHLRAGGLHSALAKITSALYTDNVLQVLEAASETPGRFEYVYSSELTVYVFHRTVLMKGNSEVLDDDLISRIRKVFSIEFPGDCTGFEGSFACRLLGKLSRFFEFLSLPDETLKPCHLKDMFASIQYTNSIFKQLKVIRANLGGNVDEFDEATNEDAGKEVKVKRKVRQGQVKRSRPTRRKWSVVDEQPFFTLGMKVPESLTEVDVLEAECLDEQRNRLVVCA
jgi:hypothetical protein